MLDLLIKNVRVMRANRTSVETADTAVRDGGFARIARGMVRSDAFLGRPP